MLAIVLALEDVRSSGAGIKYMYIYLTTSSLMLIWLRGLTHVCLDISLTVVVRACDTWGINSLNGHILNEYL